MPFVNRRITKYQCLVLAAIVVFLNCADVFAAVDMLQRPASATTTLEFSPAARQLAEQLNVLDIVERLSAKQKEYDEKPDLKLLGETTALRQKLLMAMQHAGFEVEEALASIDGDLTFTNMQLAYFSAKRERSQMLNNVATFVGSGTFGLLDSSTSIKLGTPTPNILGILGNCVAVGVPLLGLRHGKYAQPRDEQVQTNVLAPILGRPYPGVAYDPVVWKYLNSVPTDSKTGLTRLQQLRRNWAVYRGVDTKSGGISPGYLDNLVGINKKNEKVALEMLKNRADMLFDLRGVVQNMYKDISELNTILLSM